MTMAHSEPAARREAAFGARLSSPRALVFLGFVLLLGGLAWPTLREMAGVWLASSTYHHCFLVAPIALWMALSTPAPTPRFSFFALAFFALAALVWLAGAAAGVALIAEVGFVSLLIGAVAAIYGISCARTWAFPLVFLYFMVPFGESFVPALQGFAARGATALLQVSGVAVVRSGAVLTTNAGAFAIAEACSGLNFLLAAAIAAVVYSWMSFRSWRKIALFTAFAIALAVLANVLRAYLVILVATLTQGRFAIGDNHVIFGWAFYGALLFVLVLIGRRFADDAPRRGGPSRHAISDKEPTWRGVAVIAGAIAILGLATGYERFVVEGAPTERAPTSLPLVSAPGWAVAAPVRDWRPALSGADRRLYATYLSGEARVFLAAGFFAHDRQGAEIAGYSTRPDDARRWRKTKTLHAPLVAFGHQGSYRIERLQNDDGAEIDAVIVYWLGARVFDSAARLKLAQLKARLGGENPRGGVFFIAAPTPESATSIRAFLDHAEPLDAWLARIDDKRTN